ncbi:MAG: DUF2865 domain-containing protein [Devosia sp.]|nr:DUF2865 domain-containing protein [Devosia sp.]
MLRATKLLSQVLIGLGAVLAGFAVDVSSAYAQSGSCSRLLATLDTLERNRDFRLAQASEGKLRELERQVQRSESRYVRDGCNDDAKAGRQLTRECRALAREINAGRKDYASLARSFETGNAVAQQREAVLQEIARFGCGGRSRARVLGGGESLTGTGGDGGRGNLFDQLFRALSDTFDGEGGLRGGEFEGYGSYRTVRTLCVRKSDGFYWPISYSTLTDYVANDAEQCTQQCPGTDVDLYYHDNPGQEPEQMINMWGEPYTALPNAFRFRTEFDKTATCKPVTSYGSINLVATTEGGQSRPTIQFGELSFPLPMRDPRRQATVTQAPLQVADYVSVPLPRRRPAAPGEEPKPIPLAPAASTQPVRIVQFGEKRVRIVGPDTPYAPTAGAGT